MFLSEVKVYSSTDTARLEVESGVHSIEALGSGQVLVTNMALGKEVNAGDLLVELDSEAQRLQLAEEQSRLEALTPTIQALEDQVEALKSGKALSKKGGNAAVSEAKARYQQAVADAEFAETEAARAKLLFEQGTSSEVEYAKAKAEAKRARALADTLRESINRSKFDSALVGSDQQAQIASLQSEIAKVKGEVASKKSTIERLKDDIEKRSIRAPVSGKIAEVAEFRVGAVVEKGTKLGLILPPGELKLIAEFIPAEAIGRLHPGQKAQVEIQGFPWTEYGRIPAVVEKVASETRNNNRVKVEFSIHPASDSKIPLKHGMPGKIEVEVDTMTPAALILRSAGQMVASGLSGSNGNTGAAPAASN